jgi:hypothetical protein
MKRRALSACALTWVVLWFALPGAHVCVDAQTQPLPADTFMSVVAGQFGGARFMGADEYSGQGHELLRDVLGRFHRSGFARDYRFYVMDIAQFNAFASAGLAVPDVVCVFTGTLAELATPDELAGIVAHEIGHNDHRHFEKLQLQMLIAEKITKEIQKQPDQLLSTIFQHGFTRENEAEADQSGLFLSVKAGFDPMGMVHTFEAMAASEPPMGTLLLDHPPSAARARELRGLVEKHLRHEPDGSWTITSTPKKRFNIGKRFNRGLKTGLFSGLTGYAVEMSKEEETANDGNGDGQDKESKEDKAMETAGEWAAVGFAVSFVLDIDLPPRHGLMGQLVGGRNCALGLQTFGDGRLRPCLAAGFRY